MSEKEREPEATGARFREGLTIAWREKEMRLGMQGALRKVRWSVAHRGWVGTVRVALGALGRRGAEPERVHPFDERYGTDTGGLIGGGSLGVGSRNDAYITAYAGVAPSRLHAALDRWAGTLPGGEAVEGFSFVDLGCGKGRALLLASGRPFREIVGVELNPELAATAERNLALWRAAGREMAPIRALCGDAVEVAYPSGPVLVFIYNSFAAQVVRAVLDALERHVRATGVRVDVLFQNEGPEMPLRADPRLQLLWTTQLPLEGEDAAAELAGSPEDVTSLYRWVG